MSAASVIDAAHLERQRAFSRATFGPGARTDGVLDHIRKELVEVEADPNDLGEWADVIILALDGACRAGHEPQTIIDTLIARQARNEARVWPDWRTVPEGQAIEHVRGAETLCGKRMGDRPWWMNEDQFDAVVCTCILKGGHQEPCRCADHCGEAK
jgi:hypothetical protein